ncbi:AAC(3) family N-acetyltransferase [Streptomyces sp. SP17BM10]|uniref:aminoglycoside N(3)-acetyltransferase n=1 Tax=Streptomyces sp. SP17BM10 TaxID=3002530 RepID=UPI002E7A0C04|nr:AAC(3) family N-acetyltransferase [Streptomyces sp. SP17BM10]MEE1789064.1 AAC(3) family N-acetyltransferase [Streptomyces sp. SP17BM10]
MVLHAQASLRALGPVPGGATTVVDALLDALGHEGTLVAYTATPENSATSRIHRAETAGLSPEGVDDYLSRMPRFDPATTPASPTMGTLSEAIRTHPDALRSAHPQTSWAAIGPHALAITSSHPLNCHLGPESPLGRLYDLDARVLTIGVPIARFTGFHLADLRMPDVPQREYRCVGAEGWTTFKAPDLDDLHFATLGAQVLAAATTVTTRPIGSATCRLIPLREAVDLAEHFLRLARS